MASEGLNLRAVRASASEAAPARRTRTARPQEHVSRWLEANAVNISRVENTLAMLNGDAPADLATISVLLRQMRTMV